jgi:preprotein translocase subunit YajC
VETQQIVILAVGIILLSAFTFLPQWQTRRRRQKQMKELHVGTEVMTVGGIIGTLTYVNAEEDRARLEIAPGVEIQVVLAAISRPLASS